MFAKGSQLAQIRPSASASTAFTAVLRTEVTHLVVCNTTSSPAAFSIYHDDDGKTYDQTSALFYSAPIEGNTTVQVISDAVGSGLMMARGASIGVKSSVDRACTFTIYGITEEVAAR